MVPPTEAEIQEVLDRPLKRHRGVAPKDGASFMIFDATSVEWGSNVSNSTTSLFERALKSFAPRRRSSSCSGQVIAMLSQAMTWAKAHSSSSKINEDLVESLEKSADAAEDRATDMQLKWASFEKQLKKALDRKKKLEENLAKARKELD